MLLVCLILGNIRSDGRSRQRADNRGVMAISGAVLTARRHFFLLAGGQLFCVLQGSDDYRDTIEIVNGKGI